MVSIKPGTHTVRAIMELAGFDFAENAGAAHLQGEPDHRRVRVGGLRFDSVDEKIVIPETADRVEIELDGNVVVTLPVIR